MFKFKTFGVKNYKLLFHEFLLILVYQKNNPSVKVWHLSNFYCCYSNKNGYKNRLQIEKLPFWTNC